MTQSRDMAVVPVDLTDKMMIAAIEAGNAEAFDVDGCIGWVQTRAMYDAMLAAAPQALANRDAPGSASSAKADTQPGSADSNSQWRPIDTLPHPKDAGLFWGALRTCGINSPLQWEVHALFLDDETHEICPNYYQGWSRDDYEFWQPCIVPAPPAINTTAGEAGS